MLKNSALFRHKEPLELWLKSTFPEIISGHANQQFSLGFCEVQNQETLRGDTMILGCELILTDSKIDVSCSLQCCLMNLYCMSRAAIS